MAAADFKSPPQWRESYVSLQDPYPSSEPVSPISVWRSPPTRHQSEVELRPLTGQSNQPFLANGYSNGYSNGYTNEYNQSIDRPTLLSLIREWIWEIMAMVLSIGSLLCMVILLSRVTNTATDDWLFVWSPNTLISVFATITKTSLLLPLAGCVSQLKWQYFRRQKRSLYDFELFDDASRGPLGAFKFILFIRWKSILGLLAAFLVLLALFLGPFFQQILTLRPKTTEVGGATWQPSYYIASAYDTGGTYNNKEDYTTWDDNVNITSAFLSGLYGMDPVPVADCPTANCTWSLPVVTLGVGSACTNVTSKVKTNCTETESPDQKSWKRYCEYTTPGGVKAFNHFDLMYGVPVTLTNLNTSAVVGSTYNGPGGAYDMVQVGVFRNPTAELPAVDNATAASKIPSGGEIFECRINFAAYVYEGISMQNWSFPTREITKIPLKYTTMADFTPGSGGLGYYTFTNNSVYPNSIKQWPSEFKVNVADALSLSYFIQRFLSAEGLSPGTLYSGSVTKVFQNVAMSITALIQQGPNSTEISGHAFDDRTFYFTQWAWLVFPLLVVLTSAGLLVATIVAERQSVIWKSSSLAALYYNLDTGVSDQSTVQSREWLNKHAKDVHVHVTRADVDMAYADRIRNGRRTGARPMS